MSERSCRDCAHAKWNDRGGLCLHPAVALWDLPVPACSVFLQRLDARADLSYGNPYTDCAVWQAQAAPAPDYAHSVTVETALDIERAAAAKGWRS